MSTASGLPIRSWCGLARQLILGWGSVSAKQPATDFATMICINQPGRRAILRGLFGWLGLGLSVSLVASAASPAARDKASDLWSLKPLVRPSVPEVSSPIFPIRTPVDAFILAKLTEKGLRPSSEASRRALMRRVTFDLTGLPPTPAEIEAFLADKSSNAYERWVDHLLDQPAYGERWARHWLDIVHFGETHGYDKDKPRPNAWPYRDYVIRSFNEDKRFTQFVQEQVAGDVLFPFTRDGIEGLGFIAAGPWDFIGHEEVPETKADGKVARHLDRDDMVVNTIQTFNSLTIQCAQCHDHKFDPILQRDYYSLQSVFAAVDRTNKKYDKDPQTARERDRLERERRAEAELKRKIEGTINARAGSELTNLDQQISAFEQKIKVPAAAGYHSSIEKEPSKAKWVQVDLGRSVAISKVVLHPCKDDFNGIGEGFGFPVRYRVDVGEDATFSQGARNLVDATTADVPNPRLKAITLGATNVTARFIRVTATQLALRQQDYIFALAELEVLSDSGTNVALGSVVSSLDSIEAPERWRKTNLTDGLFPGADPGTQVELLALRDRRKALIERSTTIEDQRSLKAAQDKLAELAVALEALPKPSVAYVGAVHYGSGAFQGTGGKGGAPRTIRVLNRGNIQKPGDEVQPAPILSIAGPPNHFELSKEHSEGDRRAALAEWITHPSHPLTWRSIVNRVWQYHFGRGLVETPNDFGHMGAAPTHPELLDWLALEFRDGGQSFKKLHRLLVTSSVYRQSSDPTFSYPSGTADQAESLQRAEQLDADNRFYWRMNRRKLEAEAVRDSLLFVAGALDRSMGGPSFQDFVIDKPEHSPHYEYELHDPEDPKSHRRSVYRFIVRSQQQPFMTTLDCADPSMQVGKRNESASPLQALTLLNNALVLSMSKHFAARLEASGGSVEDKIRSGFYAATGRPVPDAELPGLVAHAKAYGLPNVCRLLFNLNEFTFVD